jgi:diguanylate cyclase (GGDEF)-like protein
MIVPLMIAMITYKQNQSSKYVKVEFAVGYCLFYTFSILTTQSPAAFVYILPMASIIMSYCNKSIIFSVFGYATAINLLSIIHSSITGTFLVVDNWKESVTFWEIQIACLVLTGIFLYFSTDLLIKRNNVIEDIVDNVYRDALTGLRNVRFINNNVDSILSLDNNKHLDIAFIDIDNFKQFNTDYGHSFGDKVLKTLSNTLLKNAVQYKNTYAIRNGGDEFLIISRTLCDDDFIQLIKDVCVEVSNLELSCDNSIGIHITISAGIATKNRDEDCSSFRELYDKADMRNQDAKDSGKNAVVYN